MKSRILTLIVALLALTSAVFGADSASVTNVAVAGDIFLNFKQHYDLGFWGICSNGSGMVRPVTAKKMVETFKGYHLDQALATFAATENEPAGKRFVWVVPGWVLTQMLDQPPERKQRVVELVKRGQLDLLANPFTTDTEGLDLETFVRGLGFSSRIARENGLPLPIAANMTDVPEHAFATATIFHHAGIKFFRTGCNPCSTSPYLPSLFWWEGPDGSRTLSMYSPSRYGTNLGPPKGWPCKSWLWLFMRGDNTGCQSAAQFQNIMAQATKAKPNARTGRVEDFARAIIAENPKLPVVKQDVTDTWIHGIMAMPLETGIARTVRPRIGALEALDTLLGQWKVEHPSATRTVADAYENSLLFGEHTWGSWLGDGRDQWKYGEEFDLAWNAGFYREVEATYQEHGDYIRAVQSLVEPALSERMTALGRAVKVPGKRIVVFNPLPWKRDAVVEVAGERFVAEGVPACGYKTFPAASRNQ